jgi:signal transduction histidine kinase
MNLITSNFSKNSLRKIVFFLIIVFLFVLVSLEMVEFKQHHWLNLPLHAVIEVIGAVFGLIVAYILLRSDFFHVSQHGEGIWIACGLGLMASFDVLHALLEQGSGFSWLSSSSLLFGGGIMAFVWLPIPEKKSTRITSITLLFCLLLIGIYFSSTDLFSDFLMYVLGSFFMLIAAIRLLRSYQRENNKFAFLFGIQCVLFCVASIFMSQSDSWTLLWWEAHFLRLIAYAIPLFYFVILVERVQEIKQNKIHFLQLELNYAQAQKEIEIAQATNLIKLYYENIVKALPIGILVLKVCDLQDENSIVIVDMNPAAEQTLSLRLSNVSNKKLLETFPALTTTSIPIRYLEVVQQQRSIELGQVVYGDERLAEAVYQVSAFPIDVNTLVVAFEDISIQFQSLRLRDEFVSVVSHELRTPLTSIRGAIGLVVGGALGELPEKSKSLMHIALQNCERLTILVNDLLDMEKIQTGKITFQSIKVPLKQVAERSLLEFQNMADQYGVTLHYENHVADALVMVDPNRLMQVIANLLSNAIKYSKRNGSVLLRLLFEKEQLQLEVIDQGQGIDESFKAIIFQKFSQAEAPSIRKQGGVGLGLNIAKNLIEQMGGSIAYQSKIGEGSRFYIRLTPVFE